MKPMVAGSSVAQNSSSSTSGMNTRRGPVTRRCPARSFRSVNFVRAMLGRRTPTPLACGVFVAVSWVWLVFVEVFMAMIFNPAMAP